MFVSALAYITVQLPYYCGSVVDVMWAGGGVIAGSMHRALSLMRVRKLLAGWDEVEFVQGTLSNRFVCLLLLFILLMLMWELLREWTSCFPHS